MYIKFSCLFISIDWLIVQLCDVVEGIREGQAWSILESVAWSSERAIEVALHAVEEKEHIPASAAGLEISHRVL